MTGSNTSQGTILGREPALIAGFVNAVLALAITFGLHWSIEQCGAVMAVVNLGLAILVRQSVTPTSAPVLKTGTAVTTPDGVNATVVKASPGR